MGDYTLTSHCLGSGSFATVHLAVDIVQHRQVACKVIKTRKRDEMKKICAEATILMSLDHPNINKFYSFEERDRTLLVFKLSFSSRLTTSSRTQADILAALYRW